MSFARRKVCARLIYPAVLDKNHPDWLPFPARIVSEAGGGTEGEDEAKNSLAFIQLAKQNERLKEALIR